MRQDLEAVWHAPGCFFVAHVAPTLAHVAPDSEGSRVFPQAAFGRHVGPAWGLIQKLPQREKPPHAERRSRAKAHFQYLHCVSM